MPDGHAGGVNSLVAVLVRTVATALTAAGAGWLMTVGEPDDMVGANIGAGLMAFLAIAVVSLVWSFLDAKGGRSYLGAVAIWAVVGLSSAPGWARWLAVEGYSPVLSSPRPS